MALCETCLSGGRTVSRLGGGLRRVYIALMACDTRADPSVCWECAALLRRASQFRLRALRAQAWLDASRLPGGDHLPPKFKSGSSLCTDLTVIALVDPKTTSSTSDDFLDSEVKIEFDQPKMPREEFKGDLVLSGCDEFEQIADDDEIKCIKTEEARAAQDSNIQHFEVKIELEKSQSIKHKEKNREDESSTGKYVGIIRSKSICRRHAMRRPTDMLEVTRLDISVLESWREKERNQEPFLSARYKCDRCLIALTKNTYAKHMETSHGPQTLIWRCDVCEMQFESKSSLGKHISSHFKLYKCPQCDLSGINKRSMYNHFHAHHTKEHKLKKKLQSTRRKQKNMDMLCRNDVEKSKDERDIGSSEEVSQKRSRGRQPSMLKVTKLDISEVEGWREKERNRKLYLCAKYKCDRCILVLRADKYANHMETWHGSQKSKWMCDICEMKFESKSSLAKHSPLHFKLYNCTQCSMRGINKKAMYVHYNIDHVLKRVYTCSSCRAKFSQWSEFREHLKSHKESTAGGVFECDKCAMLFSKRTMIKKHLKTHNKTEYNCSACNHACSSRSNLTKHYQRKHSVAPVPSDVYCVKCKKQFYTVRSYEEHMNRTHSLKERCTACGLTFSRKSALRHHYNFHHLKLTEFHCDACDKHFYKKSGLIHHKKHVHDRVPIPKTFMCIFCGRGFSSKVILTHHVRTHTGERPFECEHCNAAFAQKTALKQHLKNIHLRKEQKAVTIGV